jgi:hypothetical protein
MMGTVTRWTLTAPALAAALVLGACSSEGISSDEAATIGDRTISMDELQETVAQLNAASAAPSQPAGVINELTRTPILDDVMAGTSLELTDNEVLEVLRQSGVPDPSELTVDVARTREYLSLLQDPATQQSPEAADVFERLNAVTEEDFADLAVQVNPRFGSWDPAQAIVTDQDPEWITPVE